MTLVVTDFKLLGHVHVLSRRVSQYAVQITQRCNLDPEACACPSQASVTGGVARAAYWAHPDGSGRL